MTIRGSLALVTDVGHAMRGWLILSIEPARAPVVLTLADEPHNGGQSRRDAHDALNDQANALGRRLRELDEEQVTALVQQDDDGHTGMELVDRLVAYWERPRLAAVDWLRVGRSRETVDVMKWIQDDTWNLGPGDRVMLAGDGFADVHGTVVEDREADWVVRLHWGVWLDE